MSFGILCGDAKVTSFLKFGVPKSYFNVACENSELSQPMGKIKFQASQNN